MPRKSSMKLFKKRGNQDHDEASRNRQDTNHVSDGSNAISMESEAQFALGQAQEDYLVSVALATSAHEYQEREKQKLHEFQTALTRRQIHNQPPKSSTESSLSQQYWKKGCLDYGDIVCDGFYEIWGDFPEVAEKSEFPSLNDLRKVPPLDGDPREVVVVNHDQDSDLVDLEASAAEAMAEARDDAGKVQAIAKLVADRMGGSYDSDDTLENFWRSASDREKKHSRSVVVLLGSLTTGTRRHRALLFKILADCLGLRSKLVRGGDSDNNAVNIVRVDKREVYVDLVNAALLDQAQWEEQCRQRALSSSSGRSWHSMLHRLNGSSLHASTSVPSNLSRTEDALSAMKPMTHYPSFTLQPPPAPLVRNSSTAASLAPAPSASTSQKAAYNRPIPDLIRFDSGPLPDISSIDLSMMDEMTDPSRTKSQKNTSDRTVAWVSFSSPARELALPESTPITPAPTTWTPTAAPGSASGPRLTTQLSASSSVAQHSHSRSPSVSSQAGFEDSLWAEPNFGQPITSPHMSQSGLMIQTPIPSVGGMKPYGVNGTGEPSLRAASPSSGTLSTINTISPSNQFPPMNMLHHARTSSISATTFMNLQGQNSAGSAASGGQRTASPLPAETFSMHHGMGVPGPSLPYRNPIYEIASNSHRTSANEINITVPGLFSSGSNLGVKSQDKPKVGPPMRAQTGGYVPNLGNNPTHLSSSPPQWSLVPHEPHNPRLNELQRTMSPIIKSTSMAALSSGVIGANDLPSGSGSGSIMISGQAQNTFGIEQAFPFPRTPQIQTTGYGASPWYKAAVAAAGPQPNTLSPATAQQSPWALSSPLASTPQMGMNNGRSPMQPSPLSSVYASQLPAGEWNFTPSVSPPVLSLTPSLQQQEQEQESDDSPSAVPDRIHHAHTSNATTATSSLQLLAPGQGIESSWWEVDPNELTYDQRVGIGSYGEVYKGLWRGTEVAIKRFLEQNLSPETVREFRAEVSIMARLRHPNIVLFMGAVVKPNQLAIVTQFVPRGSLFRLLHRVKAQIDPKRRLAMAIDIAKGMHYLHSCRPMIVHRDLKSPNLLVDKDWTVKVADFGLSQVKSATFLTSRSHGGTPEWMAPEILRNERCDEMSDVYSYGVVLFELLAGEEPWSSLNPMQVVGAVGFSGRRLQLPSDLQPEVVGLIKRCWADKPEQRCTFAEILHVLNTFSELRPTSQQKVAKVL